MKILELNNGASECNKTGVVSLFDKVPAVALRPDSSLLKDGKPFFVPDIMGRVSGQICLCARIGRLGKAIPARFAYRYVDALTLAACFTATACAETLMTCGRCADVARSMDGATAVGKFLPTTDDCWRNVSLRYEVNGAEGGLHVLNDWIDGLDEMIEALSSVMSLREGDLLLTCGIGDAFEARPNTHISGYVGEHRVLNFNVK
jgi:2-keto-4-pentenoate hydratase/2-oxohepta-3-ene-1,7-dioic acid hydratase in catechol pathway